MFWNFLVDKQQQYTEVNIRCTDLCVCSNDVTDLFVCINDGTDEEKVNKQTWLYTAFVLRKIYN